MPPIQREQPARIRLPGLGVSAILLVILILATVFCWMFAEKFAPALLPAAWKSKLDQAKEEKERNPQKAIEDLEKALQIAQSVKTSAIGLAEIRNELGITYLEQGDREKGEKLIEQAIAAAEAGKHYYKMAVFCQDASWAEHTYFWKYPGWKPKFEYQKKAVDAMQKKWGDQSSEYYLWTLAQLYIDLGNLSEAEKCLNRATAALKLEEKELDGYQYGAMARLYALQHKWDKSLDYFLKNRQSDIDQKGSTELTDRGYKKEVEDANPEIAQYDFSTVQSLLENRNFSALDDIVNKLISKKVILPDGHWRADKFFHALALWESDSEQCWQTYLNNLNAWVQANPNSSVARIALANAYVRYAWKARGAGWAETVSDNGWKLFADRLKQALSEVRQAQRLSPQCPFTYHVLATIALGQQWSRADYDKMVAECHAHFPDYLPIYMSKIYYLQPRWNGTNGEAEDFIKALADKTASKDGEESGDIVYTQLIWSLDDLQMFDNIFSGNKGLDWQRAKRGLRTLVKRYPHDSTIRAELISLALQADDQDTVKQVFTPPP